MVDIVDEKFAKVHVDKYYLQGMIAAPHCRNWVPDRGYCDKPAHFLFLYETNSGAIGDWILCRHHLNPSVSVLKHVSLIKRYVIHCIHKLRKYGL